jgi:hypothetical protein
MQHEFQRLLDYCKANKLAVNFRKSHYVVISSQRKKSNITIPNIEKKIILSIWGYILIKILIGMPKFCIFQKTWVYSTS